MENRKTGYVTSVIETLDETPTVRIIRFAGIKEEGFSFKPGQYFKFSNIDSGKSAFFSIASSPLDNFVEIAVRNGSSGKVFYNLKIGKKIKLEGPFGKAFFDEKIKKSIVLIVAGTAITPSISIIRYCTQRKLANNIKLFYSVKTLDDIIYEGELNNLRKKNKNLRFFIKVTRHEKWHGKTGRIDKDFLVNNLDGSNQVLFIWGSGDFVSHMKSILDEIGIEKDKIKSEL